ncbi:MAG: hypothetical protein ABIS06_06145 [Vicinamibacterales bacterium]
MRMTISLPGPLVLCGFLAARPDIASRLCHSIRFMPAIPIAESKQPPDGGWNQADEQRQQTNTVCGAPNRSPVTNWSIRPATSGVEGGEPGSGAIVVSQPVFPVRPSEPEEVYT